VPRQTILDRICVLDPLKEHQRIVYLSTCYDFPFDTTRALEFALFRTFCVPSISGLLDRTGEFQRRAQKRYDDTDILVSEILEWGYDSERGKAAIRRMNQLHARFRIANEDFLYVLSTFIYEPIRWNRRFGWRPMCEHERLGLFHFWCAVGRRMHIRDIPTDYVAFEQFNRAYERDRFRFEPSNQRVGRATLDMFAAWFPGLARGLVRQVMYALMDEPLLRNFDFPRPSPWLVAVVEKAMQMRARVLRWCPPRRRPRLRTASPHRSYPRGYRVAQLGPPGPSARVRT
jgi:hypothetical protein